jgi:hypothetical protein
MPTQTSFDQIRSTLIDLALRFGPKLLVATLILIVGFFVSRWASRWFLRAIRRVELEPPIRALLARLVWLIASAMFVILALQNLGIELLHRHAPAAFSVILRSGVSPFFLESNDIICPPGQDVNRKK